ncbi:MAG TPA: sulfatase-like hydrolase/transferase [Gemmatimonadales bacterium]|nr:sulfatase-like hydrolase/transferase [Gemmatimonadales bacterium]
MPSPGANPRSASLIALGLWVGILTGFAELAKVGFDLLSSDFIYRSRDASWMIPAFDAGLFGLLAVVIALMGLRVPVPWWFAAALLAGLGTALVLLLVERLHPASALVVAAGIGAQTARLVRPRVPAVQRVVRRTLPWLAGSLLLVAVGTVGWRVLAERRAVLARSTAAGGAPNVLLLILDTVRAANLSLYHYPRPTTPELERFALGGTVFERAFAAAPWTLPSHASIFTGQWETSLQVDDRHRLAPNYPTLAEAMHARGYATAAFVSNARWAGWESGFTRGFERYDDHPISLWTALNAAAFGKQIYRRIRPLLAPKLTRLPVLWRLRLPQSDHHRSAEDISRAFLAWVDRDQARPFFAFLNFMDAHLPYTAPDSFRFRFRSALPRLPSRYAWSETPPVRLTPTDLRPKLDMYDGSIAYLDSQLGRLFDELERRELLDNTIVIVTADHGDEFAEHGVVDHGSTLYRFALQVPLVIRFPGKVPAGRRVPEPVSLRNLAATVLDLTGPGAAPLPGCSLARFWAPSAYVVPDTIIASNVRRRAGMLASIAFEDWRYIRNDETSTEELYHFEGDSLERWNMVDSLAETSILDHYRAALAAVSVSGRPTLSDTTRLPAFPVGPAAAVPHWSCGIASRGTQPPSRAHDRRKAPKTTSTHPSARAAQKPRRAKRRTGSSPPEARAEADSSRRMSPVSDSVATQTRPSVEGNSDGTMDGRVCFGSGSRNAFVRQKCVGSAVIGVEGANPDGGGSHPLRMHLGPASWATRQYRRD